MLANPLPYAPHIAHRTGIGDATHLSSLSIHIISPLPGVGQILQYHAMLNIVARAADHVKTLDGVIFDEKKRQEAFEKYAKDKSVGGVRSALLLRAFDVVNVGTFLKICPDVLPRRFLRSRARSRTSNPPA